MLTLFQAPVQTKLHFQVKDVVGCFLDLNDRTIAFSLNGELLLVSVFFCPLNS